MSFRYDRCCVLSKARATLFFLTTQMGTSQSTPVCHDYSSSSSSSSSSHLSRCSEGTRISGRADTDVHDRENIPEFTATHFQPPSSTQSNTLSQQQSTKEDQWPAPRSSFASCAMESLQALLIFGGIAKPSSNHEQQQPHLVVHNDLWLFFPGTLTHQSHHVICLIRSIDQTDFFFSRVV